MTETKKKAASVLALPPWTAAVLVAVVAALAAVYVLVPDHRDEIATAIGAAGAVVLAYMRGRAAGPALALLGAIAIGGTLVGCGASPLRQHATAARMTMVTLAGAGVAIEQAAALALARCPHEDGEERAACIDGVEHAATRAAAARDVMVAPAHAYRDAVQASGGEETPGLLDYLGVVARPLAEGWPDLAAALSALGVPVPAVSYPITEEAR